MSLIHLDEIFFEGINSVGSYKMRVLINPLWSTGDQGGNFRYLVHFQSGNLIGGKKYITGEYFLI